MDSNYKFFARNKNGKFEEFTFEMAIDTIQNQARYIDQLRDKIDKAIEVLKLCDSKCSKETIIILKGDEQDER